MAKKRSSGKRGEFSKFGVRAAFGLIFTNVGLFLPLAVVGVLLGAMTFAVGEEAAVLIWVLTFLMLWLVALFFVRQITAGKKVKFRDGLYNAMTPLVSILLVFVVLAIQCVPAMLIVIGYSAAVETNLFGNMFYASLFVLFALLVVVLSGFLLSGTMMALVAVSVPGMYPLRALELTHELMIGERVRFVLRMLVLILVLVLIWGVLVGLAMLVNLALYNWWGVQMAMLVPIMAIVAGCVSVIYVAVYLYLYYKELIYE